ncbi:PP2C family protein-serine/threonine phosphatase [Synechococcus sp. PCC 6312]|uniref:PP2C family protein-serine/threonine phosphatase n=1 Tax=Synechococcus sp. (strain ATCC 27167 / PCC 6312) TaxID=195253 RepID=UPI0002F42398|nr:SpoIIE family protein phosphatase [Synechococcus sp. PCC 6312]
MAYHILVIDDDPTTRLILAKNLRNQGYEVTTTNHGEAGISTAREIQPALIICDWMMPGLDGLEVCRRIKADPDLASIFFVLLTAKDDIADRIRGLDAGADEFLSKPIERDELRARVQAGLRLYQANQELKEQKHLLETELNEAAIYVRSLLPKPVAAPLNIDLRFIPSSQLGGDCCDFFWLDETHLVLFLLDVSGHGLGAALPSVSLLNLLRSQKESVPQDFYHPARILSFLNDGFQMSDQNDKYFTIWYGVYNRSSQYLTYASAGHPPALLIHPDLEQNIQVTPLKTPSLPIGMFDDVTYQTATHPVAPGSMLYVFSDGIYEFNTVSGQAWTLEEFGSLLARHYPEKSNLDIILAEIQGISAPGAMGVDDISLVQVQF